MTSGQVLRQLAHCVIACALCLTASFADAEMMNYAASTAQVFNSGAQSASTASPAYASSTWGASSGWASASMGALKSFPSTSASGPLDAGGYSEASGISQWLDTVTILAAGQDGLEGLVLRTR